LHNANFFNKQIKMKKTYLFTAFILFCVLAIAQKNPLYNKIPTPDLALRFLNFLNVYQTDSLEKMMNDDFLLTRTYAPVTNDKESFLDKYITKSKATNASFTILKELESKEAKLYLVEDKSDYYKHLNVKNPNWKISISIKDKKVLFMSIDTVNGYTNYVKDIKAKDIEFNNWLATQYPDETSRKISNDPSLLIKRLKEFSEKK
jgi:hypothetical protein